jgi:hypothetical protein
MDTPKAGLSRSKTWTKEQRAEFGRRLTWARERAGYDKGADALRQVEQLSHMKVRTYYSHEAGDRVPDDDGLIQIYAQLFRVPMDYLLLRQTQPESDVVNATSINQVTERLEDKSSQITDVRYISILTASDIRDLLTGRLNLSTFSGDRLPVPKHVAAGNMSIFYQIPNHDNSMVGADGGPSFQPGTFLLVDPDREIAPGDYLVAMLAGTQTPVLRRLQSPYPYVRAAPRYPFKLIAINALVEPLTVTSADDCTILGRMIFIMQGY